MDIVYSIEKVGSIIQNIDHSHTMMEKKLKCKISNLPYEINDPRQYDKYRIPKIMTVDETFEKLVLEKKSIARFGDGEFAIMYGIDRWRFQSSNPKLAERLIEVITSEDESILIGLINFYGDLSHRTEKDADAIRSYITPETRRMHMKYLKLNRVYACANVSRNTTWEMVRKQKQIWDNRDCIFVEGYQTRMGVGNNLFDNAKSIERILCPAENAFDKYDDILNEVSKQSKDKLILIALGATASVLAYDLAKKGFQAIDIGHADLSYEWLLRNNGEKTEVKTKYNNEYPEGYIVEDIHDPIYESQIIADFSK